MSKKSIGQARSRIGVRDNPICSDPGLLRLRPGCGRGTRPGKIGEQEGRGRRREKVNGALCV